jgi:hypothetical protein
MMTAVHNDYLEVQVGNMVPHVGLPEAGATPRAPIVEVPPGIIEWIANEGVPTGAIVKYNGALYSRNVAGNNGASFDPSQYTLVVEGAQSAKISDWQPSTTYSVGAAVHLYGLLFKATVGHTSSSSFAEDLQCWTSLSINATVVYSASHPFTAEFQPLVLWDGGWSAGDSTSYNSLPTHAVVCYNTNYFLAASSGVYPRTGAYSSWGYRAVLFANTTGYFSTSPSGVYTYPVLRVSGSHQVEVLAGVNSKIADTSASGISQWATGVSYSTGSSVLFRGILFRCTSTHISTNFGDDLPQWESGSPEAVIVHQVAHGFSRLYQPVRRYGTTWYVGQDDSSENVPTHVITAEYSADWFLAISSGSLPYSWAVSNFGGNANLFL